MEKAFKVHLGQAIIRSSVFISSVLIHKFIFASRFLNGLIIQIKQKWAKNSHGLNQLFCIELSKLFKRFMIHLSQFNLRNTDSFIEMME